ncbi:hypothetical protein ACIRBX_26410 [Kitasatospora sp. NPDC096147]|uniref:hypothetical protein n=1 Tax=Kitasatospora sp. NPDC096147 TaxID=3364093 RepID=UPI003802C39E
MSAVEPAQLNRSLAALHAASLPAGRPPETLTYSGVPDGQAKGGRDFLVADELLFGAPEIAPWADLDDPGRPLPVRVPVLSGALVVLEDAPLTRRVTDYHLFSPAGGHHVTFHLPGGGLRLDLAEATDITLDWPGTEAEREVSVRALSGGTLRHLLGADGVYDLTAAPAELPPSGTESPPAPGATGDGPTDDGPTGDGDALRALATEPLDPARRIRFTTSSELPFVRPQDHRLFFFSGPDGDPLDREPVLTLYGPGSLDEGAPVYVAPTAVPAYTVAVLVAELTGGPEGDLRGIHTVVLTPDRPGRP